MVHQHYGTQTVNRGAVMPGMLVKHKDGTWTASANLRGLKWFTEFGHLNRGDMLTSEQHRCHNEKKKFQRRV